MSKLIAGIGGKQYAGPSRLYKIKFSSDMECEYDVLLQRVNLGKDLVILGQDFLSTFSSTTFDWENHGIQLGEKWVYFSVTDKSMQTSMKSQPKICASLPVEQQRQNTALFDNYQEVFAHNPRAPRESSIASHSIQSIDNRPCKSKIRRLPNKWKQEVNDQVDEMLQHGIISPSKSAFNSNALLVTKRDDPKRRFAIDFRQVNTNTVPDSYPLPNVDDLIEQSYGCII